ncbi:MAG TPA: glycosyltransferase family 4 protein [Nocardioides sp.]|nr:glycosyltransferase family 4 protein [Nocardioides sp.]
MTGSDRLRILWFSTTPSSGGSALGRETAGGGWIRALERELNHRVHLTVAFYHESEARPYELGGTTFVPLLRSRRGPVGKAVNRVADALESEVDVARLTDVVDEVAPDLIHVHGTEGPFGLVQRHTRVPVLISLQSVLSVYELKYFSGLDRWAARRFAGSSEVLLRNSYADRYRRFAKQAEREREMLGITRHLTGRTTWDRRAASLLAPKAEYHHLDEILRRPFYERHWQPPDNRVLELFTTTGPNLYKGFETLVRCAGLLDESGVDYRWRVAGLAPDDPFVALFLRALHRDLPPRVELLGTLTEADLADLMLGSDLYVGVSHIENSANSLCEAQLMGLPCIATYAGGTPSLVTDDQDGVLVQDGDPYALAGAVLDLARDPGHAARLGSAGRTRASTRHRPDAVADRALSIYEKLVNAG